MIAHLTALLLSVSVAIPLSAIRRNNEGVHLMQKKESYKAYQKFVDGLSQAPFDPFLHMNLGLSFETNEEYDKALKEYELVARDENMPEDIRFQASFNAARMKTQLKDIPGALQHYQAALDIKPGSNEVKTNIELLWQGGQGGGQGDNQNQDNKDQNQDQKDQKDQKNNQDQKEQNKDQKQGQQQQPQKPQPQKFESKELSQQDVQKILEEIKNQEQQIRAEFDKKNQREVPRDKNW